MRGYQQALLTVFGLLTSMGEDRTGRRQVYSGMRTFDTGINISAKEDEKEVKMPFLQEAGSRMIRPSDVKMSGSMRKIFAYFLKMYGEKALDDNAMVSF